MHKGSREQPHESHSGVAEIITCNNKPGFHAQRARHEEPQFYPWFFLQTSSWSSHPS